MKLPIFPLNGAVLYPGTSLPLNIFEERYIEMINYSMSKDRKIGMIQKDESNNLYSVGCVGKIHSFNETADGRYLISLLGSSCFKLKSEINSIYSFRIIEVDLIDNLKSDCNLTESHKSRILECYKKYINVKRISLDLKDVESIGIEQLIKFIAMVSPFKDIEKQALLETLSIDDFYNKLVSIIELDTVDDENGFVNKTIN